MFCRHCGKEINDDAVVCINCGRAVSDELTKAHNSDENANGGLLLLSFLIPLFGIIYGCIDMSNGKKKAGKAYLTIAIAATFISALTYIISICVISDMYW